MHGFAGRAAGVADGDVGDPQTEFRGADDHFGLVAVAVPIGNPDLVDALVALAAGLAAVSPALAKTYQANGKLAVGLIGCGGRNSGAAVEALNADLPYDQFVRRQLAADLIGAEPDQYAALGFLGLSPVYHKEPKLSAEVISVIVVSAKSMAFRP